MGDKEKEIVGMAEQIAKARKNGVPCETLLCRLDKLVAELEELRSRKHGSGCDCWSCVSYR